MMRLWRFLRSKPQAALAAVVYVPLLLTRPSEVTADTKTYLSLDPSGVLEAARFGWDPSWGLGVVPHQGIGYLWPMGPWFWLFDAAGVPDWAAQRLWTATLVFAAGAGVMWLGSVFGWRNDARSVAGFVYALSPYALSYATRISALLLPWTALGWLIGLLVLAARRQGSGGAIARWQHPAIFALVTMTVGGVNAPSLLYAGLGVVLWLPVAVLGSSEIDWRMAWAATWRIAAATTLTGLWWASGLLVQARHGAPVLDYSETLETVASGSNAAEAFRGLGYWVLYGGDRTGPWVSAGVDYTQRPLLIGLGYVLPIAAVAGLTLARWPQRAYVGLLMVTGLVATVGLHPIENPSPAAWLADAAAGDSAGALALRSSPRALPLYVLAMASCVGFATAAAADALARRARGRWLRACRLRALPALAAVVVAAAGVPSLWTGRYVGQELARPQTLPSWWTEAAADLSDHDDTRVLILPGSDFSAHRWGNTIDHVLAGLTERPVAVRELVAFMPAAAADLLIAVDRRLQENVANPATTVSAAALLGAGDIALQLDLEYERYRTPRPLDLWTAWESRAEGVYEPGYDNRASPDYPLLDERELAFGDPQASTPALATVRVAGARSHARLQSLNGALLLSGSAEGLLDVMDAGLLDPDATVLYAATTPPEVRELALAHGAAVVITDSDRVAARRWKTVRDNVGHTERADGADRIDDPSDARLDLHGLGEAGHTEAARTEAARTESGRSTARAGPAGDEDTAERDGQAGLRTTARQIGATVTASSYGNSISYHPENRPVAAFDGDPATSWRARAFDDVAGSWIQVDFDEPRQASELRLLQPVSGERERRLAEILISVNGRAPFAATLDERSLSPPGQPIRLAGSEAVSRLRIEAVRATDGTSPSGFAEIAVGDGPPVQERILVPAQTWGSAAPDTPVAVVLTRLRTDPANAVREDTERFIARDLPVPDQTTFSVSGVLRISARAEPEVIDRLLFAGAGPAASVSATAKMPGPAAGHPRAVIDGSPATAWRPPFGPQAGHRLVVRFAEPQPLGPAITLSYADDDRSSQPRSVGVSVDGGPVTEFGIGDLAPVTRTVAGRRTTSLALPLGVTAQHASRIEVELLAVDERPTTDWFSGEPHSLPVAVTALDVGLTEPFPATLERACRSDLLTISGRAVPVRIVGIDEARAVRPAARGQSEVERALLGEPLRFEGCAPVVVAAGTQHVDAADGRSSGLDVDQVVLASGAMPDAPAPLSVEVERESQTARTLRVPHRSEPMLLAVRDSFNEGWSLAGHAEAAHLVVDGHANAWLLAPGPAASFEVRFGPQRVMDAALLISAAAAAACAAAALAAGMHSRRRRSRQAARRGLRYPTAYRRTATTALPAVLRGTAAPAVLTLVLASAVTRPVYGIVAALLVLAARRKGPRAVARAYGAAAAVFLAAAGLYQIYLQVRYEIGHGGHWPDDMARAHELAWVALAALIGLVTHVVWPARWRARPPQSG